jgi:RND family efflux transporter MFP subunit
MQTHSRSSLPTSLLVLLIVAPAALAIGCGSNEYAAPPPPHVTTMRPIVREVTRYIEYTGTTRAVESVEVRARVKGFLMSMHFEPGEVVEEGELLFIIDPEPFEIALAATTADLASNQAELDLAQVELDRTRLMYQSDATSEINLIQRRAHRDKAAAAVAASRATVHSANLDLEYAHVKAPITGRVGRHLIDMGNLVGASDATKLTEIVRYSPTYVYFHMSERDVLGLQAYSRIRREAEAADFEDRPPTLLEVGIATDSDFPAKGRIDFTALEIDPDTGTFEVRGILPNEGAFDEIILPGSFVRVRIPLGVLPNSLLVTESALGADQSGRFLLVVTEEDKVEQRRVTLGSRLDGMRVIESGLRPDEWVIVNGLQRARPGAKVTAKREAPEAAADSTS